MASRFTDQSFKRPRVLDTDIEKLRRIRFKPIGVTSDEELVAWAIHVFCMEHAPARKTNGKPNENQ